MKAATDAVVAAAPVQARHYSGPSPVRGTSRSALTMLWIGHDASVSAPPVDGPYMLAGVETGQHPTAIEPGRGQGRWLSNAQGD